jgi:hypothetical protein
MHKAVSTHLHLLPCWCWPHGVASPQSPLVLLYGLAEPAGLEVRIHLGWVRQQQWQHWQFQWQQWQQEQGCECST